MVGADPGPAPGRGGRGDRLARHQREPAQGGRFHRSLLLHAGALRRQTRRRPLDVTPEGLEGKKIAVTKGTAHEAYLRTFFRDSSIRAFETPQLARDALANDTVDLLFEDGVGLVFWLNGTASKACCEFKGGPFGEPKYFGDGVGIAVNREDSQLKTLLNAALKRLRESGPLRGAAAALFPPARVLVIAARSANPLREHPGRRAQRCGAGPETRRVLRAGFEFSGSRRNDPGRKRGGNLVTRHIEAAAAPSRDESIGGARRCAAV